MATYIEKDFWVCHVLDGLYNGRAADQPRLLFKGGTSLAKVFGVIHRFSEDIDMVVFFGQSGGPVIDGSGLVRGVNSAGATQFFDKPMSRGSGSI